MDKPNISPDFTIEDIHKIREYNHEATKDMTFEDRAAYYKVASDRIQAEIAERKKEKQLVTN